MNRHQRRADSAGRQDDDAMPTRKPPEGGSLSLRPFHCSAVQLLDHGDVADHAAMLLSRCTITTGTAVTAHTSAATQPTIVQPRKKFKTKIASVL